MTRKVLYLAMETFRRQLVFATCLIGNKETKMFDADLISKKSLHRAVPVECWQDPLTVIVIESILVK